MKFKSFTLVMLPWLFAMTSCASAKEVYWERTDSSSTASLTSAQANALLNQDLAACAAGVKEMNKDHAMPADSTDLEDCMQGEGWKRKGAAPPNPQWLKANDDRAVSPPRQQAQFHQDKHEVITDARYNDLVPPGGQITLGLQGYQDRYNEPGPGVNVHTNYFGGVAGYTQRFGDHYFWTIDGRVAHGNESYNSPSGIVDNVPEYEGEARLTAGHEYAFESSWLSAYTGLGSRIFRGDGKNHFTNLGAFDYDRRIEQLYAPIGATWRTLFIGHMTMTSSLEVDPLLIGSVNSRLSNGGGPNVVNTQGFLTGYGLRGEVMFGAPIADNKTVEFGPFFRYWNINNSTPNIQNCGGWVCNVLLEPDNKRTQIGITTRITF